MQAFRGFCGGGVALGFMVAALATATLAVAQPSVGRGAPDPLHVAVIVGSEGKGMYAGAGVPADNMPIYAAKALGRKDMARHYLALAREARLSEALQEPDPT